VVSRISSSNFPQTVVSRGQDCDCAVRGPLPSFHRGPVSSTGSGTRNDRTEVGRRYTTDHSLCIYRKLTVQYHTDVATARWWGYSVDFGPACGHGSVAPGTTHAFGRSDRRHACRISTHRQPPYARTNKRRSTGPTAPWTRGN